MENTSPEKPIGNPNHDSGTGQFTTAPTSFDVSESSSIKSFEQAKSWWDKNIGGKVLPLLVHVGRVKDGWNRTIKIKVDFPGAETHAYTQKSENGDVPDCFDDPKHKNGPRTFLLSRAKLMDRIVQTIEYPQTKAVQFGADLLFERKIDGHHHVVALAWSSARKLYVFDSSYTMPVSKVAFILGHQDRTKNDGPLQKSEPSGSAPSVFRDSTESGSYPTGSKPVTVGSIGFCRCCDDSLIDAMLLGKSYLDIHVVGISMPVPDSDVGTYLGKAIKPSHEHDIWAPFDSPYLADLVEAFTHTGQSGLQSFKDALLWWLASHGQPHKKNSLPALLMPDVPVHWTQVELSAWSNYFHSKPRALWLPEDYSMLVEWLLQQYWSPQWASSMANWLAVKSTLLGQIEAGLAAKPPSALVAAGVAAAIPANIEAVVELGLPVSAVTRAMVAFARERCAQAIVDMGDRLRAGVRSVILEHQQEMILGGKPQSLEMLLFDKFSTANRDWRRIAVTEVSENAAQGVVSASGPGAKLKRIEQYKGVCAWCHKIDGRVVTVVDPAKPNKDGMTEIWAGKTNIGRSSSPKKMVDGRLYDREPDELWWIASGAQHVHCRGRWLPFTNVDPAKYDKFMAGVMANMAKFQAEAAAKQ